MPSEAGDQSRAIMYLQDLPSSISMLKKALKKNIDADSDAPGYKVGTINLWDTGTYKTPSTITEQIHRCKVVELSPAGAKLYGRFHYRGNH